MRKKFLIILLLLAIVISVSSVLTVGQASVVAHTYSTSTRNSLSTYDKALYDQLSSDFISLTNSDATQSTTFTIDLTKLGGAKTSWAASELVALPQGTTIVDAFVSQFDISLVLTALTLDMPLETFWYDKTEGSSVYFANDGKNITTFKIKMQVTTPHRGLGYDTENPSLKGVKTIYNTTYQNALYYVDKWAGVSDYAKVKGYVQDICALVSYEDSVTLPSYDGGYTDVWQATYVFDNDTTTNVVCEGYAKAFQLLCNLSNFSDLTCYTINGSKTGGHMWNIVTIDGNNYLVDVTNTDEGAIGSLGGLVLNAPKSGNASVGYTFGLNPDLTYTYKPDMFALFSDTGILTLASSDYNPPSVQFSLNGIQNIVYDGSELTIGNNSTYDIYYTLNSGFTTSYNWDWEFFIDDNGSIGNSLGKSVTDAGVYWLKVSATRKLIPSETVSLTVKFEIKKAKLTISNATFNKIYDGNKSITTTSITLNGIKGDDQVSVDYNNSLFETPTSSAGSYEYIFVKNLVFDGRDATNYTHDYSPNTQVSISATIQKRSITATPIYEYANSALTFDEFDFSVSAQYNGATKSGTVTWYDDGVEIVDTTTPIERGKVYTWILKYTDTNFADSTGTVEIYPNETVYSINATSQDATKGTVSVSKRTFLYGESVTLTANAKNGYKFDGWVIDGVTVSTSEQYTFGVTDNTNIVAKFVATTTSDSGSGSSQQSTLLKIIDFIKVIIPYLPYIIVGVGVVGFVILVTMYSKICKSKKKK